MAASPGVASVPSTKAPEPPTAREALQGIVTLLEKSVRLKDTRLLMGRLLRQTAVLRKQLTADALRNFINTNLTESSAARSFLHEQVPTTAVCLPRGGQTGNQQITQGDCTQSFCFLVIPKV